MSMAPAKLAQVDLEFNHKAHALHALALVGAQEPLCAILAQSVLEEAIA